MDKLPKLVRDLLYADEHRLLEDEVGRAARRAAELGVADGFVRGLISGAVDRHKIAQARAGPFPAPHLWRGDLVHGLDVRGRPVVSFIQYRNGHLLVVAGSGAGKTTRAKFEILQIAPIVRGIWLYDFRKREFAPLRPYLTRLGVDLCVVNGRSVRINPLQVPLHVHPADYAPRCADMLERVLRLPPRASKLLHTTILRRYQNDGILAGGRNYPTLFHIRDDVASDRNANPQSRFAIVDSLDPILISLGPGTLGYHMGWSTHDLSQRHIAWEFCGLAEVEKDLLLNTLVLSEFTSRVAQGVSNPRMDLYIVCDEAARLVSTTSQSLGLSDLIGLVRGTGIGLDLSVQSSDVASVILSNTANKTVGRCGSTKDYDTVGGAMGLTPEQRRWMSLHLRPGLFVGQLGEGDWRYPFVYRCPFLDLGAPATAGAEHLGALAALPVAPAPLPCSYSGPALPLSGPHATATAGPPVLPGAELRYLEAVVQNPGLPSSAYPALAKVGARRAQAIRQRLVGAGFLKELRVNLSARGRSSICLEPTPSALKAVGQAGPAAPGGQP